VRSRFKEQNLNLDKEHGERRLLAMGEAVEMLRAVKKGKTDWREEIES
jgi:hypothetical protein